MSTRTGPRGKFNYGTWLAWIVHWLGNFVRNCPFIIGQPHTVKEKVDQIKLISTQDETLTLPGKFNWEEGSSLFVFPFLLSKPGNSGQRNKWQFIATELMMMDLPLPIHFAYVCSRFLLLCSSLVPNLVGRSGGGGYAETVIYLREHILRTHISLWWWWLLLLC